MAPAENNIKPLLSLTLAAGITSACCLPAHSAHAASLPDNFVYLKDIDPMIRQQMRYAGAHNFVGRPINGYEAPACILTQPAATALKQVQAALARQGLSLMVYDCYRPTRAVADFWRWSQNPAETQMQAEFYPRTDKARLFDLGYIAHKSGHSRGSTVDLTIVPLNLPLSQIPAYNMMPAKLTACFAPYGLRFKDGSIDMGTGFDCLDVRAYNTATDINPTAYQNRMLLKNIMEKYGFDPYQKEWWHFTLKNEPYPHTYFDFVVK